VLGWAHDAEVAFDSVFVAGGGAGRGVKEILKEVFEGGVFEVGYLVVLVGDGDEDRPVITDGYVLPCLVGGKVGQIGVEANHTGLLRCGGLPEGRWRGRRGRGQ
jgi:hypothetical protein